MHRLVIKSRFRFFRFWVKISNFEYGNCPSLNTHTWQFNQEQLLTDVDNTLDSIMQTNCR